jgi:hypothetical protein
MSRITFVIMLAAAACSSTDSRDPIPPLPSSLVEAETVLEQHADSCLASVVGPRSAIASELDRRAPEIAQWLAAPQPDDEHYHRVRLGPIVVRELVKPLPASSGASTKDWVTLGKDLDSLRGAPIDAGWISFDENARGLFVDDWYRVRGGLDYSPEAASKRTAPGLAFRSDAIERFLGTLRVSLDPGPFADVTDALAAYIEPVWSSDRLVVRITWTKSNPDAFRFAVDDGPGGRSFVTVADGTVHLFSDVRATSIAHEFGHVLGFRDHYETTFDPTHCAYTQTADPNDLMADSSRGRVTDDEWNALDQTYP